jgi:hypothetical protein
MVTFKVLAFLLNMYSNGSAMPGNIAENNLPRVHSVLSPYCSEYLYVIQNETITIIILVLGTPRSHMSTINVPIMVLILGPSYSTESTVYEGAPS